MSGARACALLLLTALGVSSCSTTPSPVVVTASAPAPVHAHGIEQQLVGSKLRFVACADCERPTVKTLRAAAPRLVAVNAQERPAPPGGPAKPAAAASTPGIQRAAPAPRTQTFTVVFDLNSAVLTRTARSRLDALVPLVNAAARVRVLGFTDDLGSQELNSRLSDQRALAVMLHLRDRLAEPRPELSATGRPQCCYITDNRNEGHRAPNRRAEILVELADTPAVRVLLAAARARMVGAPGAPAAHATPTTTASTAGSGE